MKFLSLELTNFGVYFGRNSIPLSPEQNGKNVVLVGGLNGRGKTTILDAIHLALYGSRSRLISNKREYEELLRSKFSRNAHPDALFSVELMFSVQGDGQTDCFSIKRDWRLAEVGMSETVAVTRSGIYDAALSDNEVGFVEEILPIDIAELFLFDGEKIASLADPVRASKIILTAVNALLGTGLISRLQNDLRVLEKRKLAQIEAIEEDPEIEQRHSRLMHLSGEASKIALDAESVQNQIDLLRSDLQRVDRQFEDSGGLFFESRREIEESQRKINQQLNQNEVELREIASGHLPLLRLSELLDKISTLTPSLVMTESQASELASRVTQLLSEHKIVDSDQHPMVSRLILEAIRPNADSISLFAVSSDSIETASMLTSIREADENRLDRLLAIREALIQELSVVEHGLLAVPSEDAIRELLELRTDYRVRLAEAEIRHEVLQDTLDQTIAQLNQLESEVENERRKRALLDVANHDVNRILLSSEKARSALETWKTQIHNQNVGRIESEILTSFQALLGKSSLVGGLTLDLVTCEPAITTATGKRVSIADLSAGERQLFAVATLWGLAKVAGRNIPTVIDTPLGRLDGAHRNTVVKNYFPNASNQVILLSTDTEIGASLLQELLPNLSHTVSLDFDDTTESTTVEVNKYFEGML